MSFKDYLIDTVAEHKDPTAAWVTLRALYQIGNSSMILLTTNQLSQMKLPEGGEMDEYLNKARELKNRMAILGK